MAGSFLGRKGYEQLILVDNGSLLDTGIPCLSQSQLDSSIQLGNWDQELTFHDEGIWLQLGTQRMMQLQKPL